jgi:hypothetical protein
LFALATRFLEYPFVKIGIKNLFSLFLPLLAVGFCFLLVEPLSAQTFTNLYSFSATSPQAPSSNSDGAYPVAGLVLSGSTLYGTAEEGGSSHDGSVFAVH